MFKGNLSDMLRQAQEMSQGIKAAQEELARREFEVAVGGGMVKMRFNGKMEALAVTIEPELLKPEEQSILQDLVLSAVNLGLRQSQQAMQEQMAKMTGGLKIPPGFMP